MKIRSSCAVCPYKVNHGGNRRMARGVHWAMGPFCVNGRTQWEIAEKEAQR